VQCALTPAEEYVVAKTLAGLSPRLIAAARGINYQSVKNYLKVAYRKLGVDGSLELVAEAYRQNALQLWVAPRAADKDQAPKQPAPKAAPKPAWFHRFAVAPTPFEERLIAALLEDPDISGRALARKCRSSEGSIRMCLNRLYNKAGVRTRAGLVAALLR
jgi:DNA-binding CsgD family transcriptional regulator